MRASSRRRLTASAPRPSWAVPDVGGPGGHGPCAFPLDRSSSEEHRATPSRPVPACRLGATLANQPRHRLFSLGFAQVRSSATCALPVRSRRARNSRGHSASKKGSNDSSLASTTSRTSFTRRDCASIAPCTHEAGLVCRCSARKPARRAALAPREPPGHKNLVHGSGRDGSARFGTRHP